MINKNFSFSFFLFTVLFLSPVLNAQPEGSMGQKRVVFAQDTMGNDWRIAQVRQVEQGLSGYQHVRFAYSDAGGNAAMQIKNIEDHLTTGLDVLITSPQDSLSMTPVIQQAYRSGVPVVLLSRTIITDDYTSFIHADNKAIARKAAMFVVDQLKGKGTVIMLTGVPGATTTQHRSSAFKEVIEQYPDIKLETRVANYLRADAIRAMEQVIAENKSIDAIFAQSDSMAIGAIMALKSNGIDPKPVTIVGIDYISEARELIRKGELDVTYLYPTAGKEGAEVVLDIITGKKVKKE
ncbi:MAG: substrate-binding domain-containing protein, partial [Gammaproteobacteria bacterium]|nr:substrate-binding domain-containing protein [Gammaproteobacteria bacterium]